MGPTSPGHSGGSECLHPGASVLPSPSAVLQALSAVPAQISGLGGDVYFSKICTKLVNFRLGERWK